MLSHTAMSTLCIQYLLIFPFFELLDELGERSQLSRVHQIELVYEIDEMLEACVEMGLGWEKHDVLEMGVVYVGVNSE